MAQNKMNQIILIANSTVALPVLKYGDSILRKKVNPINYFFNDLTPNQYEEILKLASVENQALGSTF